MPFELSASHPAHQMSAPSHGTSSRGGGISNLLAQESAAPANCWTFDAEGLSEGITLDLQHPSVNGAALVMGEGAWVLRDNRPQRGALYTRDTSGRHGLMRRATLTEKTSHASGREFCVFSVLDGAATYSVLHVDIDLPCVKPKVELIAGIVGDEVMRAGWTEGLYRLSEHSPIIILRKDGSVVEIVHTEGKPLVIVCDPADALLHRLDYIQMKLRDTGNIRDPDAVCRQEDRLCHNLVSMLELLQRVRNDDERTALQAKVVDFLVDLNDEGMLRKGVRSRLANVLDRCADSVRWRYQAVQNLRSEDRPMTAEQQAKRQVRLAKRAANLQARAAHNQAHHKGPSAPANPHKGKGRK